MYFAPPNHITWLQACAQFTRTEKVPVHEKYRLLMNHSEDYKIGAVLHQEYWLYPER